MRIAVLIPTLNAGTLWKDLLYSIESQSQKIDSKIIIDSGSSDDTVDLAKKYNYQILTIKKENFDHGYARELLAQAANDHDILIYLTQDCVLAHSDSIKNLITAFNDPLIGISYGRQLPRIGATVLEAHARSFNYPDVSVTKTFEDRKKLGIKTASCSNSFAAYRKIALEEVGGFPKKSIFGEDVIVGGQMLIKGWSIAYVANADAYHSHNYTSIEEFKRYFDIGVFHSINYWLIQQFGKAEGEGMKYLRSEFKYVLQHNAFLLPKFIVSTFAKYWGYKIGLRHKKLTLKQQLKFTMHKKYWEKK